jgi:hypothetical protein
METVHSSFSQKSLLPILDKVQFPVRKSKQAARLLSTLLLVGYPLNTTLAESLRTWTDVRGRTIEARPLQADLSKNTIEIERHDGVRFTLPIAHLSQGDQQFISNWQPEGNIKTSAVPNSADSLTELTPAQWKWLTEAGSITERRYVNFPADQLVTFLNARLKGAHSTNAKESIKGVRINADDDITEINAEFRSTVSFSTFLKGLAEQNSLQLHVDGNGFITLQRVPTSAPKLNLKFLGT